MEKEKYVEGKYWWSSITDGFNIGPFDTLEECCKDIDSSPDEWEDYCDDLETDWINVGVMNHVFDVDDVAKNVKDYITDLSLTSYEENGPSFSKDFDAKLKDLIVNEAHFVTQVFVDVIGYYNVKTHKFEKEDRDDKQEN